MAKRKDPANQVVEFFETAEVDTARTVLAIVKGIVDRRSPASRKPRVVKSAQPRREATAAS